MIKINFSYQSNNQYLIVDDLPQKKVGRNKSFDVYYYLMEKNGNIHDNPELLEGGSDEE